MKVGDTLKFKKAVANQIDVFFKQRQANVLLASDLAKQNMMILTEAWEIVYEHCPEAKNFELTWASETKECTVLKSKQAY
jgi:hypothetical protein